MRACTDMRVRLRLYVHNLTWLVFGAAAYEHGVPHSHAGAGGNGGNGGAVSQMSSTDQAGLKSAGKEIAGCCYAFLTNPFSD